MRPAIAAFALAVSLAGAAAADKSPLPRVVVTAEQAVSWRVVGKSAAFTPAQTEVDRADAALAKALETSTEYNAAGVRARWPNYGRQYFGLIANGRRTIVINAFCSWPLSDPSKEYVDVLDGGACFFRARYDVESDRITGIIVNGYA